jgi:hypothetical protein
MEFGLKEGIIGDGYFHTISSVLCTTGRGRGRPAVARAESRPAKGNGCNGGESAAMGLLHCSTSLTMPCAQYSFFLLVHFELSISHAQAQW